MVGNHKTRRSFVRVFALTLAVLSVLFLAQVLTHSHQPGQNEATCQVCQAAHLLFPLTAETLTFHAPVLATGSVQPFVLRFHQEFFFEDSSSRAPPTA
jgi:hypothetical protein